MNQSYLFSNIAYKTKILTLFVLLLCLLGVLWMVTAVETALEQAAHEEGEAFANRSVRLGIHGTEIEASVADTPARRSQGFSDRSALYANEGMLFVFEESDLHGMVAHPRFSTDVLWLDNDLYVVSVAEHLHSKDEQGAHYPDKAARYALELPGGFISRHGIALGDRLWVLQ